MSDRMLTPRELAERWSKSEKTLETYRRNGEGPAFVRLGRQVRYRESDVKRWEAENTVTTH